MTNATSLEAFAAIREERDLDLKQRIVAALKQRPESAEQVANRIGETYHDVERRCSWLLGKGLLQRAGRTKNASGRAASLLMVTETGDLWAAGLMDAPSDRKASRRAKAVRVLKAARVVYREGKARDGLVVVPMEFMVDLGVALQRLDEHSG